MKYLASLLIIALLAGCSNTSYEKYADGYKAVGIAEAEAETARWNAIAKVAENGDTAAKVGALFALAQGGQTKQHAQFTPPKSTEETIREWAGVLVPGATQMYAAHENRLLGTTQSFNARDVSLGNYATFGNIAGQIQAPAGNSTVSTTSTNTASTTTATNTDSHDATSTPTVVTQPAPVQIPAGTVVCTPSPC